MFFTLTAYKKNENYMCSILYTPTYSIHRPLKNNK